MNTIYYFIDGIHFHFPNIFRCQGCNRRVQDPKNDCAIHISDNDSYLHISCIYHSKCAERLYGQHCSSSNCGRLIQKNTMLVIKNGSIIQTEPMDDIELQAGNCNGSDASEFLIHTGNKRCTKHCQGYLTRKKIMTCTALSIAAIVLTIIVVR